MLARLQGRTDLVLDAKTLRAAKRIVEAVRRQGDEALLTYCQELDGSEAAQVADLALEPAGDEGPEGLVSGFAGALERAIESVTAFHRQQVRTGFRIDSGGVELAERRHPLSRVGVYVPGGRAAYPSTVLMTVIPARLAGVEEIVVATPAAAFGATPELRYTLKRLEVGEIWGMGGAHAVAALAYGTETIRRVDKIVGPGNQWVTAAKRLVSGDVGIDGLAGPSEVMIVAQEGSDAPWVAADLLAQAEHDPNAAAVLVTDSRSFARRVAAAVEEQLPSLATSETAEASLRRFGGIFVVPEIGAALPLIEAFAPEHLQLIGPEAEALEGQVRHAGAIFLGASTPEVFGDYLAGPSHVLPTCGSARFTSALGVEDFIRRSHTVRFSPEVAAVKAEDAAILADAEGLPAHAAAARRRSR
ncbi:MAG: histidinol dehydrogenase [Deltaproteobacteria bacterium]|nr:histidinol dehydrogenase [Deltaproteobacteria bacterium]